MRDTFPRPVAQGSRATAGSAQSLPWPCDRRCQLSTPDWSEQPSQDAVERALELNAQGRDELEQGALSAAEQSFMAAIKTVPLIPMTWFNLGLVYKSQRRWQECAACNRRSVDLGTDEHDPAFWNLGIAATAVRDWGLARWAWNGFGIEMDAGAGPIEMG